MKTRKNNRVFQIQSEGIQTGAIFVSRDGLFKSKDTSPPSIRIISRQSIELRIDIAAEVHFESMREPSPEIKDEEVVVKESDKRCCLIM